MNISPIFTLPKAADDVLMHEAPLRWGDLVVYCPWNLV